MRLCLAFAAAVLVAPLASAQPVDGVTNLAGGRDPEGAHVHDGFYLRVGTGVGTHLGTITVADSGDRTEITGVSSVSELAIGAAIAPGLIFGGGFFTSNILAAERAVHGAAPPAEVLDGGNDFSLFGPFVDYYVDPTRGLHFQAAVGVVTINGVGLARGDLDEDETALGAGVMFGVGYDWWVSDEWSIGLLGRITLGTAVTDELDGQQWTYDLGAAPSLLVTATFN
jgi:hypothetical protein